MTRAGEGPISRVRNGVQRMGMLIDLQLLQLSAMLTRTDVQRELVDLSQLETLVFREIQSGDPARDVNWIVQPSVIAESRPLA